MPLTNGIANDSDAVLTAPNVAKTISALIDLDTIGARRADLEKQVDVVMASNSPLRIKQIRMKHLRNELQLCLTKLDELAARRIKEVCTQSSTLGEPTAAESQPPSPASSTT